MNKYALIGIIIAILIVISLFIEIPDGSEDNVITNNNNMTIEARTETCENTCNSYVNTRFYEYKDLACYCEDIYYDKIFMEYREW